MKNFIYYFFQFDKLTFITMQFIGCLCRKICTIKGYIHGCLTLQEGPTPVSALIHAATMVTSRRFFVNYVCHLYQNIHQQTLQAATILGDINYFFCCYYQHYFKMTLKKLLLIQTCSQLGYMVFACGLSSILRKYFSFS